jgi:ABC-2 type transport system permease protein
MKWHRIRAIMLRHTYEVRRNLNKVSDSVLFPVLSILMWGLFTLYLSHDHRMQSSIVGLLLGAAILWGVFFSFQRDVAVGFLDELWSRNLVNIFSTPLSVSEYLTGLIIVNLIRAMVGMLAVSLVAWLCYSFDIFPSLLAFVPYLLNLVLFALALGVVITGLIFRYTTRIQGFAWSFASLLMPVSCVFYPLSSLPHWLQPVAWALPTTHAFEGMRAALSGAAFSTVHFEWGLGLNAIYFVFAFFFFRWIFESARARGLLVKIE